MRPDPATRVLFRQMERKFRDHLYRSIEFLAVRGMHARTIAEAVGVSVSQVYTACGHLHVRLRDYRDGLGPVGAPLVKRVKDRKGKP